MVEIGGEEVPDTDLVRALGDKYNAEILSVTGEPRSAKELDEEFGIPIATGYRRIEKLTDLGLLTFEESVLTDERRRRDTYRRQVNGIAIEFADNDFAVTVEEQAPVENKLDDIWRTLSDDDGRSSSPSGF
jgi:predicted transcriptional regulator